MELIAKTVRIGALTLAVALAVQAIYVAYFGGWEPSIHRAVALFVCTVIVIGVQPLISVYPTENKWLAFLYWKIDLAMVAIMAPQ